MPELDETTPDGGLARMIANFKQTGLATGDPGADAFLRERPTAVLMGILFDQRVRAETAFIGPYKLYQRLGHLDLRKIAEMDEASFKKVFTETPAVHRFANVMSARTQAFAKTMIDLYEGDVRNLFDSPGGLDQVKRRVKELQGFGPGKLNKLVPAFQLFGHDVPK